MRMVRARRFVDDGVATFPEPWAWGDGLAGMTVVVLGNGPSLADADPQAVRGRRLVAVNSACRWAQPVATPEDLLYFTDNSWNENHPALADAWPGIVVTANRYAAARLAPRAKRLDVTALAAAMGGSQDGLQASSGHTAVTLALAMGARRVVLLGFDARSVAGRTHWHRDYAEDRGDALYRERFVPAWHAVAAVAERLGAELLNATPGSAIDAIPFRPLEAC